MSKIKFTIESSGHEHTFQEMPIIIGRSKKCDLILSGQGVAKRHARVEIHIDGYYILDLNSVHGIMVNGNRVVSCLLKDGDSVQVGTVTLKFHELESSKSLVSLIEGKANFKVGKTKSADPELAALETQEELEPIPVSTEAFKSITKPVIQKKEVRISEQASFSKESQSKSSDCQAHEDTGERENWVAPITIFGLDQFQNLLIDLSISTRYDLHIVSHKLERSVFSSTKLSTVLFETTHQRSTFKVNILVKDTRDLLRHHHELVELSRRIPNRIIIKQIPKWLATGVLENYVIFDGDKILYQKDWRYEEAELFYSPAKTLALKAIQFRYLWEMSQGIPELKSY